MDLLGRVRKQFGIELGEGHERGFLFPKPISNLVNYFEGYEEDEERSKERILQMVTPWEDLMYGLPKFLGILPEDYPSNHEDMQKGEEKEENEEKKREKEELICGRSKELRRTIDEKVKLPEFDVDLLERATITLASKTLDVAEEIDRTTRRAFFIFCIVTNSYIWPPGLPPVRVLPSIISRPLVQLSKKLEQPPIITHASMVLNNWTYATSTALPSGEGEDKRVLGLDTLALFNTFTGSDDEFWFFGVAAIIEAQGGQALKHICDILDTLNKHKDSEVPLSSLEFIQKSLGLVKEAIGKMTVTMGSMSQRCSPHIFYHHIRKFLPGWINNDLLGEGASCGMLFEGVKPSEVDIGWKTAFDTLPISQVKEYSALVRDQLLSSPSVLNSLEDVSDWDWESLLPSSSELGQTPRKGVYLRLHGGSAGQSSLLHALDTSFSIHHKIDADVTTETESSAHSPPSFLHQMRYYMVKSHRAFLEELERQPSISKFIISLLRSQVTPSSSSGITPETLRIAFNECVEALVKFRNIHFQVVTRFIIGESVKANKDGVRGTGGSNLASFLKAVRDETKEAVIKN